MIARLQRLIVFTLLSISLAWLIACWVLGHPVLAVAGALLIVLGYAGFLAAELIILLGITQSDSLNRGTWSELIRAWWGEVRASPQVFFWRQPFRSDAEPDSLPPTPNGSRGVLLVHGFVCNRGFWNPWMTAMRRAGISFIAIDLEPPFSSISNHAAVIEQAVARLMAATGLPPLLVAHSMGGLAVRHWLASRARAKRIHRVITIGTPHGGTWLARYSRTTPGTEMAIGSTWLHRLEQCSNPSRNSLFTCFYSNADNVVFPASLAPLPGADNRLVRAIGHVQLAFHRDVFDEAWRCLRPSAPADD